MTDSTPMPVEARHSAFPLGKVDRPGDLPDGLPAARFVRRSRAYSDAER